MVALKQETPSDARSKFSIGEFGLNEVWEVAQRRWKFLAFCALVAVAGGVAYCYFGTPWYESRSQILVMRKDTSAVTSGPTSNANEPKVSEDILATHMSIVMSEKILDAALSKTVKKSVLEARKAAQAKNEEQVSGNLKHSLARNVGWTQAAELVPLPKIPLWSAQRLEEQKAQEAAENGDAPASMTDPAAPPADTAPASMTGAATTETATPATTPAPETVAATPAVEKPADATAPAIESAASITGSTDPAAAPVDPNAPVVVAADEIMLRDMPGILANLDFSQKPSSYVLDHLSVGHGSGQAREAHVLSVSFAHPDQVEAQLVVDAILQSYQEFLNDKFQDVNKEAAKLIESASGELAKDLEIAQNNYKKFREEAPIIFASGDPATNIHRQRFDAAQLELTSLQGALVQSRTRMDETERKYVELKSSGLPPLASLALIDKDNAARMSALVEFMLGQAQSPEFLALSADRFTSSKAEAEQLQSALTEEKQLLTDFGPAHPSVKAVRTKIEQMEAFLKIKKELTKVDDSGEPVMDPGTIMTAYITMIRNDVAADQRKEQELQEVAAREEEMAKSLVSYELEAETLKDQVARAQDLNDAVLDRLREINLAKDYSGFINEIIQSPEIGAEVWPDIPLIIALSGIVGLALGAAGAGYMEYRDRSFRDPNDIRRDLDLPLLTHVPDLRPRGKDAKVLVEGSTMHTSLYAFHRPKSRESEVFRGLRTSLFFSAAGQSASGQKCQVIMFTSPNQGDGKSTVTSNLSVSIAQAGKKVLLIDCDLRRPNVHKILGLPNEIGLSDVICGDCEPADATQQTEVQNLWAITSGPLPANPAELLTSTTFEQFIKVAREKYDFILLDCPPVLAVADPCIVAPRADGLCLVLRVSKDSRPQALRAKEMLSRVNAKVLGVVVNASQEAAKTGYGRYGDSAYGYSYDNGYGYNYGYNKYYEEDPTVPKRTERKDRPSRTDRPSLS